MWFIGFSLARMYLLWIQSSREESYPGVRKVDVFISISIEYHKEPILKEIERKLIDKGEGGLWAKEISNVVA
jgi:hypothetical protein